MIFKSLKLRFFGKAIYSSIVTPNDALEEQIILKDVIDILNKSTEPKKKKKKQEKNAIRLLKVRQKVLNGLESKMFPVGKQMQRKGIKILNPKQMLQTLPITLAPVKAGNTSQNLLR